MHEASGAGELLGPHSSPPPQELWCGLCAPCNDQCPAARLVRAPGGSGGSWAAWWVPPQWSESGCVTWVLFSIRWGTRSRFQVQPFYYSDDMCLLSTPWIQKPNCRQVTRLGDIRAANTGSWEASLICEATNPTQKPIFLGLRKQRPVLLFPAKITHTRTRSEGPSATPGLNHTNVFPYSSEVRNLESNVSKAVSSGAFRGECVLVFPNFQRLPTCPGLWPLPPPAIFFFFDRVRSQLWHKASSLWPVGSLAVAHVGS